MNIYIAMIATTLLMMSGIETALAVPPPEFLFAVGSQLGFIFSVLAVLFSGALGIAATFAKSIFSRIKHRKIFWSIAAVVVMGFSLTGGYLIDQYRQQLLYQQWVQESTQHTGTVAITNKEANRLNMTVDVSSSSESASSQKNESSVPVVVYEFSSSSSASSIEEENAADLGIAFIQQYYANLGKGRITAAYEVSEKSVSLETYKSWYKDVVDTFMNSIQRVDDNSYALSVTVTEKNDATTYAVLMRLTVNDQGKMSIAHSQVKVLGRPTAQVPATENQVLPEGAKDDDSFFLANRNLPLSVSNEEFQSTVATGQPFVLDAREDEEYEIGRFPESLHLRFADLLSGEWIQLPNNKVIYVVCWSGIRGKEVTEFLRSKNMTARYIEKGADGWVAFGGKWDGGIRFLSKYTDERYQLVFSTDQVRQYQKQGVILVDSRPQSTFEKWHIPDSINIPIMYTPSARIEEVLSQVPPQSTVMTVCDDFVSCFDAKVTGVKLEKRGNTFLGRYNKPWEYRSTQ